MPTDTTERIAPAASELQTLVVVSGAHLISHLHIMVLPVLLPLLKEQMNVGFFELGLALTTFNVVTGLTQAPMGFLVDRVGAKIVLIAGLMLGGLAFMSLGFTTTYAWLIVTAVLAGLANCVYHPADYAILTRQHRGGPHRQSVLHSHVRGLRRRCHRTAAAAGAGGRRRASARRSSARDCSPGRPPPWCS